MRLNGSLSSATRPDSIRFSNAAAASTEITVLAAASHGPSGKAASSTRAPCALSRSMARLVADAMSEGTSFHALPSHPMRNGLADGIDVPASPGFATDDGSRGSWPEIRSRTIAQSSAVRPITPILSMEKASAIPPCLLTRPYVGLSPVTPQYADGQIIEPQVSVPIVRAASAALVIAADPLEEPQVQQLVFQGFFAGPHADADANRYPSPPASSLIAAFPINMAPACL